MILYLCIVNKYIGSIAIRIATWIAILLHIRTCLTIMFQLGLAEEFKKPIINVRVEEVSEIDPGLKLIIQRRQVLSLDYIYS